MLQHSKPQYYMDGYRNGWADYKCGHDPLITAQESTLTQYGEGYRAGYREAKHSEKYVHVRRIV